MGEDQPSTGSPDTAAVVPGSAALNWRSLAPSVSIAVFLAVATLTINSSGASRIGVALIAGLVLGLPLSYLFDTYWTPIRAAAPDSPPTPGDQNGS